MFHFLLVAKYNTFFNLINYETKWKRNFMDKTHIILIIENNKHILTASASL